MFTRRVATAAVLLALFGAACGTHSGASVAAGAGTTAAPAGASLESTTTTAATLPSETAATDTSPEPALTPVKKSAPTPSAASIEIDYQPNDGDTATATIDGPDGSLSKSLDGGSALFNGLTAGTYAITITVDSAPVAPSDGTGIGTARQIANGQQVHVEAGEHAVISCDDNGCTGTL